MFFQLLDRIASIATKHSGKSYLPIGLTKLIRSQLRDSQLKFYTHCDARIAKYNILVTGEYVPIDDENNEQCIHIYFTYSNLDNRIQIDKLNWSALSFYIASTITHEYIHQYHIRNRNYQFGRSYVQTKASQFELTTQDYLGCEDELIAHGFNCAAEILVHNKQFEKTPTYKFYKTHFKTDHNVLTQLKNYTTTYINQFTYDHNGKR